MASVSQKIGMSPYWMAKFRDETGRIVMRSTKETHRRKAQAIADEWEAAAKKARAGELTQAASIKILARMMEATTGEKLKVESIADFLRRFVASKEKATAERYKGVVEKFLAMLGERRTTAPIGSVTAGEVERFRDAQLEAGKSATTANYFLAIITAALARAQRQGLALSNPALAIDRLNNDTEEREVFSDDDIRKLLAAAGETSWRGMILLGLHCGIRLKDAASLTWDAFELDVGTITFRAGKTDSKIVAVLHADLLKWLKTQPRGIGKAPVFPDLHGKETKGTYGLSEPFGKLVRDAGIVVKLGRAKTGKGRQHVSKSYHSLRHTFISRLANLGISRDVRKAIAGHSTDAAHDRYTHLEIEAQRQALAKIPSVL